MTTASTGRSVCLVPVVAFLLLARLGADAFAGPPGSPTSRESSSFASPLYQTSRVQPGESPILPTPPEGDTPSDPVDVAYRLLTGRNELQARVLGATQLLTIATEPALERLIRALRESTDAEVSLAVCRALSQAQAPPAVLLDPVLERIGDERPGISDAAAAALRRFEAGAIIPRLVLIAQDDAADRPRRLDSVRALASLADDLRAVEALAALLESDSNGFLKPVVLDTFVLAVGAPFPDAAAAADWWKKNRATTRQDWLRRRNELLRRQVRALQEGQADLVRRVVALCRDAYVRAPDQDRPRLLLSFLKDGLAPVRQLGLEFINVLAVDRIEIAPEIRAQLGAMILDPSTEIRPVVAKVVGDLRLTAEAPRLMEAIAREADSAARAAQTNALGRLANPDAIPVLIARLDDPALLVVGDAAAALGEISSEVRERPDALRDIREALRRRFDAIPRDDDSLRERFLKAMAQLGGEDMRAVFLAELAPDRPSRTRQAAIRGLATFADPSVAATLRPLASSTQPAIRQSAAAALGIAGRATEDLQALADRLDSKSEPDAGVRQEAWDAYRAIAARLPPAEQLRVAADFSASGDKAGQQRRLDLLRGLETQLDSLAIDDRIRASELIGDTRLALGETEAAVARYRQALNLSAEGDPERRHVLTFKLFAALLADGSDVEALATLDRANSAAKRDPARIAQTILAEISARLRDGRVAPAHHLALQSAPLVSSLGSGFAAQLDPLAKQALKALADQLIASLGNDPDADKRLMELGAPILPQLVARLSSFGASTQPAGDLEIRLVSVVRAILPDWRGFAVGASADDRAAAIAELEAILSGASSSAPAPPSSAPAAAAESTHADPPRDSGARPG